MASLRDRVRLPPGAYFLTAVLNTEGAPEGEGHFRNNVAVSSAAFPVT